MEGVRERLGHAVIYNFWVRRRIAHAYGHDIVRSRTCSKVPRGRAVQVWGTYYKCSK